MKENEGKWKIKATAQKLKKMKWNKIKQNERENEK